MRFKSGFTLIEMVVGIVVLAVAMTIVTGVFLPQASQTLTPMYQIRATGLAKSIMNQVLVRSFDEQNMNTGGFLLCDATSCTDIANFGVESESESDPNSLDDVDDYHVYCDSSMNQREINLGYFSADLSAYYPGYGVRICVASGAEKFDGLVTDKHIAKLITVTVSMPNDETVTLSALKGNY